MSGVRVAPPGRFDSRGWGVFLAAGYVLLAALPVVTALAASPASAAPALVKLGRAAGLLGFAMLALQVALTSRVRLVERPFGLDRLTRLHKRLAVLACALLLLHPVLLALGEDGTWKFSFFPEWKVEIGEVALALVVLGVLLALTFTTLGMRYEVWRLLHKGMAAVVALGFVHALVIGFDVRRAPLRVYLPALFGLASAVFLYRNVFVPLWGRRRFRVASVTRETHDTFTLALEAQDGRPLPHRPGQFMFLTLLRTGMKAEEHPFTIASAPTREGPVTVTIKQSGDFTNTIGRTKPGDAALVEAPFGRFSFVHTRARCFLFIAGGIGITPIVSMLRALADLDDQRPAVLLWGNKTERDIPFREELARLPKNVTVVHVLSKAPEGWTGATGYVTAEVIRQHAHAVLEDGEVFLCGPPAMMTSVLDQLRSLGVDRRRIHYERFAL